MNRPGLPDRRYAQRLAIAFAASVFLHEIVAGLWPHRVERPAEERVVAQAVTLTKRTPPPKPTAAPTPRPTPHITPAPRFSLAPRIVVRAPAAKAAATPARTLGGAAARRHVVALRPQTSAPPDPPRSLAEGTHFGQQNGGSGTGGGAGTGTGGLAGAGSGTAASGNGNGGDTNSAPCGDIFFLPGDVSYRKDGSVIRQISVKIEQRDGTSEVAKFPYPFVYASEAQDPFSHDVGISSNGGIPVQLPPAGTDLATLPALVQVVLKHTNATTGATELPECNPEATP